MANTRDTMGEQACLDALVAGTLTELEDDEVYELRGYAFYYDDTIESVSLPSCKKVGDFSFASAESLSDVNLPACERVGASAFNVCNSLTSITLPACNYLGNGAFASCQALRSITLGYDGVVTRANVSTIPTQFNSGNAGTIYVPASQLAAYQASSSWSGYNLAAIPA